MRPAGGFTPDTQPSDDGYNGILGIGPFIYDCGATCATSSNIGQYYTCSGSNCVGTAVPLTSQVQNVVAFLPIDKNGLIVELPSVAAGGLTSLTGSLVFGIGTQSNNLPSGATTYTLDQFGDFITTFNGVTFNDVSNGGSFIDTGSNGLFFPSPSRSSPDADLLPICTSGSGSTLWFCPSSITNFAAVITGSSGSSSNTVPFQIGNFNSLTSSSNNVYGDIGGNISGAFDWGLPFFFGKNVYIGFENKSSLGTGQYFAY